MTVGQLIGALAKFSPDLPVTLCSEVTVAYSELTSGLESFEAEIKSVTDLETRIVITQDEETRE